MKEGLSLLCKTGSGLAHAYVKLEVKERCAYGGPEEGCSCGAQSPFSPSCLAIAAGSLDLPYLGQWKGRIEFTFREPCDSLYQSWPEELEAVRVCQGIPTGLLLLSFGGSVLGSFWQTEVPAPCEEPYLPSRFLTTPINQSPIVLCFTSRLHTALCFNSSASPCWILHPTSGLCCLLGT